MAWQEIQPHLYGGIQPLSGQLTVASFIAARGNTLASAFVANSSNTEWEKVRLAIKPYYEPMDDRFYILYDTPVAPQGMLQLAYFGLGVDDEILVCGETGYAVFNVTGTTIINRA